MDPLTRYLVEDRGFSTPCWIWQGARERNGYGLIPRCRGGTNTSAHRFFYMHFIGEPGTHDIDHLCRQRDCVNPEHLEAVTHAENCRRSTYAKLTTPEVRDIKRRFATMTVRDLAVLYGVSYYTIWNIRRGRTWVDV